MKFIESVLVRKDRATCGQCGYSWFIKDPENPPRACPKCHSVRWWKEKTIHGSGDKRAAGELQP